MPINLYLPTQDMAFARSGIAIEYTKSRKSFYIHGWYDYIVGIQGEEISLGDFLRTFKITLKDCEKALNNGSV